MTLIRVTLDSKSRLFVHPGEVVLVTPQVALDADGRHMVFPVDEQAVIAVLDRDAARRQYIDRAHVVIDVPTEGCQEVDSRLLRPVHGGGNSRRKKMG